VLHATCHIECAGRRKKLVAEILEGCGPTSLPAHKFAALPGKPEFEQLPVQILSRDALRDQVSSLAASIRFRDDRHATAASSGFRNLKRLSSPGRNGAPSPLYVASRPFLIAACTACFETPIRFANAAGEISPGACSGSVSSL
jgi:hypothetical protein